MTIKIAKDKVLHFVVGAAISVAIFAAVVWLAPSWPRAAALFSAFVSTTVGWAKEYLYDAKHTNEHTVDKYDWYATANGGLVGSLGAYLVYTGHLASSQ